MEKKAKIPIVIGITTLFNWNGSNIKIPKVNSKAINVLEKNAAKEVKSGLECGITFKNFLDFKEKDMIESYKVDMIERQIND